MEARARARRRTAEQERAARAAAEALAEENARLYQEARRALDARLQAEVRWRLLADAGEVLSRSLEYETTLASVARLAVPALADRCAVDVLEPDGSLRLVGVAHVDPAKERLMWKLRDRYPPTPGRRLGLLEAIQEGRPTLVSHVDEAGLEGIAHDAEHLALLREMGFRSFMIVPLVARRRPLGQLIFHVYESGRRYGPDDLALAEELAGRCALAIDNARLYQQLQQALAARDRFLAAISHDLRTPLASVRGYAQMIRRVAQGPGAADPERLTGLARQVEAAGERMSAMVGELLDVAGLELGQTLALRAAPTDLVALARRALAAHQQATAQHVLRVEVAEKRLVGQWDRARLERVLDNLVSNALKFSPDGGEVVVGLAREQDAAGSWAVVSIRDQGIGIPAAELARVFDRFHRAANAAGRIVGTGLGLAGVRDVVEQHGGTVAVESVEGRGTTVVVRLPITSPDATS